MNAAERMMHFIAGKPVDRIPYMPIFMRYAAEHADVGFGDFILDVEKHCQANIQTARDFHADWVNVMSDPYCEMDAYGAAVAYPENGLALYEGVFAESAAAVAALGNLDLGHPRCRGRIEQCGRFRELVGGEFLICGWVEGPVAEYCDLRTMGNAFLDFYDEPRLVKQAFDLLLRDAERFITEQVQAGADCIGIGDAACSQIGRELYLEFAFEGEKRLVDHIHSLGALAKLHICGNTSAILPDMIRTGADIIDVDHLVTDMTPFAPLLAPRQVLCGNLDPVSVIQNGTPESIRFAALAALSQAPNRLILSGGCEIPPATPRENLHALSAACAQ